MSNTAKTAIILIDDKPGHINQSLGLFHSLESSLSLEKHEIKLAVRFKGLRFLMRFLANNIPARLLSFTLPFFYKIDGKYKDCNEPIIISSGGNTLYANIVIKAITDGLNLYSGTPKQFPQTLIDLIYTVVPLDNNTNNIVLDLPPANIYQLNEGHTPNTFALLIGGNGAGYQYKNTDWKSLIQGIEQISKDQDVKWLITTSRRSGDDIENLLADSVNRECISDLVLYGQNPAKVMAQYLQKAEIIFCTEDSLTMVSEAIYSGKKVYTLVPEQSNPDNNDLAALNKYQSNQLVERCLMKNMDRVEIDRNKKCSALPDIDHQISQPVIDALLSSRDTK